MLKRWGDALGYGNLALTAVEATWRIPQRPVPPSKYADAVWKNDLPHDLSGKTFAITGTGRGLGFVLAKNIAMRGGNLILLNRESANAAQALDDIQKVANGRVSQVDCDLLDFERVRKAAIAVRGQVEGSNTTLDCLVLNAGLMALLDVRTGDGYDPQMQANHLSHFLLTASLFDLLEKAAREHGEARIVSHSSGARHSPDLPLREDSFEQAWAEDSPSAGDATFRAKWARYQQSKRANLAFTYSLADVIARKGADCKVKAVCAHPGATNSGLQSRTHAAFYMDRLINGMAVVGGQSPEDGCLALAAATLREGAASGDFFGPKGLTGNAELLPEERSWGAGYAEAQLRMLWQKSVAATKVTGALASYD